MHRLPRYRSSSLSSEADSQSSLAEINKSLVIPDLSFSRSTTWATPPGSRTTTSGRVGKDTEANNSTRDGGQSRTTWTAEDAGNKTSRPIPGYRGVSDTMVPTIALQQAMPELHRQVSAGPHPSVFPGIVEQTGLSLDRSSSINTKSSSSTNVDSMSSEIGSLASYRTDLSRQIEHGIPDKRMLDYARSVAKASKEAHRQEQARKQYGQGRSPNSPNTASARVDFSDTSPLSLTSSVHFAPRPDIDPYQRSAARRPFLSDRSSQSEDVKASSSSAPVTTFTSPAPADGQPRRGSAEQQSEKGYFSFRYKPTRPQSKRCASQQNVSTASKPSAPSPKARPQCSLSLSTGHIARVAPPTPFVESPPEPFAERFSPAPSTPSDPHATGAKRPSKLRKMFSSLMTPRSESVPAQSRAAVDRTSEQSASVIGDYFGQSQTATTRSRQPQHSPMPIQGYNAGEAVRVSTPPELKKHRRRPPGALGDDIYDYSPGTRHEASYNPGSALDDWGSDEDTSKHGTNRNTGLLPDSAVRYAASEQHPSGHWFRERTVEIDDDDGASVLTFDWDIPVHLPNSPLCPLHPKYRGSKKGVCAYHGRRMTQPTQPEEKASKDSAKDKRRRSASRDDEGP